MANILLLNGPNLDRLGSRETDIYGGTSLAEIEAETARLADSLGHRLEAKQSNAEHELIATIHDSPDRYDLIIFNPAGFTHTSVALRDALLAVEVPFIEVHLSNIAAREPFRRHSYFTDVAVGFIAGFGPQVYELAVRAAAETLSN